MNQSAEIKDLVAALNKAQAEIQQPSKKSTVTTPKYTLKFADLGECFKSVREPLQQNGLVVSQIVTGTSLRTMLLHTSGQWIAGDYPLPVGTDDAPVTPQQMGSAITYARRYALCAMLGLVGDTDEDGNAAEDAAKEAADKRAAILAKVKAPTVSK